MVGDVSTLVYRSERTCVTSQFLDDVVNMSTQRSFISVSNDYLMKVFDEKDPKNTHHADTTFFPNVRELLSILAVLPLGSCEAERSFSCVRRIHSWLRSSMSTDRLSDLCVIAMHGNIPVSTEEIVNRFITLHPRRMQGQSLFSL
ncbi:repressor of the inhibitor of the protein kinase [Nymphon striatum]|nr:repressor of the inhibitor of the protein kinase [Nymphon striatum]